MHNANEGLLVIGLMLIVWGSLSLIGGGFFQRGVVDRYARRYTILDEQALIKHDLLFRILLGLAALLLGLFQNVHESLTITLVLLGISFIIIFKWEQIRKQKYLQKKDPKAKKGEKQ